MSSPANGARVEIRWHFYDKQEKRKVVRWIPGRVTKARADGRFDVVADCGWVADAAPECVRLLREKTGAEATANREAARHLEDATEARVHRRPANPHD